MSNMAQTEIGVMMKEIAELMRRTRELRKLKNDFKDYASILGKHAHPPTHA